MGWGGGDLRPQRCPLSRPHATRDRELQLHRDSAVLYWAVGEWSEEDSPGETAGGRGGRRPPLSLRGTRRLDPTRAAVVPPCLLARRSPPPRQAQARLRSLCGLHVYVQATLDHSPPPGATWNHERRVPSKQSPACSNM